MPYRIRDCVAGAVLAVAALLAGCGLTSSTQVTQSEGVAKHAYRKIAIIAMSASRTERQVFDDAMVARLAAVGVDGIVGDRYIENAASANGISAIDALRAAGADGVIYVWLRPDGDNLRVEPAPGDWGWTGTAAAWYPAAVNVKMMMTRFDARLYDVGTQELAWSAFTTKFYPTTLAKDAPQVADAIVAELVKRGFIAAAR